jgi:hypothetical protein
MKTKNIIRLTHITLLAIAVFSWSGAVTHQKLDAQTSLGFGGLVNFTYYCSCSYNYLMTVGRPSNNNFMYQPFYTRTYLYYMIPVENVWLLGTYTPGATCLQIAYPSCTVAGYAIGTMDNRPGVGTSLSVK